MKLQLEFDADEAKSLLAAIREWFRSTPSGVTPAASPQPRARRQAEKPTETSQPKTPSPQAPASPPRRKRIRKAEAPSGRKPGRPPGYKAGTPDIKAKVLALLDKRPMTSPDILRTIPEHSPNSIYDVLRKLRESGMVGMRHEDGVKDGVNYLIRPSTVQYKLE